MLPALFFLFAHATPSPFFLIFSAFVVLWYVTVRLIRPKGYMANQESTLSSFVSFSSSSGRTIQYRGISKWLLKIIKGQVARWQKGNCLGNERTQVWAIDGKEDSKCRRKNALQGSTMFKRSFFLSFLPFICPRMVYTYNQQTAYTLRTRNSFIMDSRWLL